MNETCPNCGSEDSEEGWSCGSYYEGHFNDDKIETRLIETAGCLRRQRDQLKAALKEIREAIRTSVNDDSVIPERLNSAIENAKRLTE